MKRFASLFLIATLCAFICAPLHAANEPQKAPNKSPSAGLASAVTTITGIAISPLLGTGAYGAYQYYFQAKTDEDKAKLAWYAQPSFFLPALLIAALCACKDTIGTMLPPGMKKPIDILETIENKASGLVAAGAVVPLTMNTLSSWLVGSGGTAADGTLQTGGLAMIHLGTMDLSWLLNILTIPFGIAVFAIVWMASHAINVLILLSPWGAIDAALKAARVSLLGLLTLTAQLDPKIAAALSIVVIIVSYLVAGWAFRLTIFGSVFCWDFLTGRKGRFNPATSVNKLFSGSLLKAVPVRTYGRLVQEPQNGRLLFTYKPWLILAEKTVEVKMTSPHVGKGLFFSTVRDGDGTLLILPPRYRDHEVEFARIHHLEGGVKDAGLLKAWGSLKELFSGSASQAQVT